MAGPGYSGYFMKGLAGGLQSGISMGTNLTQLKWAKKKKKEIDELNVKMNDTWNTIGQEIVSLANDGQLSEDDKLKIYAMTMAAPYEMQSVMQNLRSSLSQFKTKDLENQMEYVKTIYEYAKGLDPKDINSIYESVRPFITDPHALTLFEVCDKRLRHEVTPTEPITEVFTSAEAVREKYPEAGVKYTDEGYVPTFGEPTGPTMADEKSAINLLRSFIRATPEQFEKQRTNLEQRTGLDLSIYTQDILKEEGTEFFNLYNTPEEVMANVKAPEGLTIIPKRDTKTGKYYASFSKETVPTPTLPAFKSLQDIKEEFKNVKTKAEYNEALASYNASKEAKTSGWTPPPFEGQLTDLIKKVETAIWADYVNKETGKLKDKTEREDYNKHLQYYLNLIEEAKREGLDISQFQAFIPYKEIYWGAGNPLVIKESW